MNGSVLRINVSKNLVVPGTGDSPFAVGDPQPDADKILAAFRRLGCKVVLWDAYADTSWGYASMVMWLRDHGIDSYDELLGSEGGAA